MNNEIQSQKVTKAKNAIVVATLFTKLGDLLLNPKVTLIFLLQQLGASALVLSLIVPVREAMSMVPQVLLVPVVDRYGKLVRLYQLGALAQGVSVFLMAIVIAFASSPLVEWLVLLLVLTFSVARCLCSLTSKAILGLAVPKGARGNTLGQAGTVAGLAVVILALLLTATGVMSVQIGALLLVFASVMWVLAAVAYGRIPIDAEDVKPTNKGQPFLTRAKHLLTTDDMFLRFLIVRFLLLSTALAGPYFVLLATTLSDGFADFTGLLVASSLASVVSASFWGRYSDHSSAKVLSVAAAGFAFVCVSTVVCIQFFPESVQQFR